MGSSRVRGCRGRVTVRLSDPRPHRRRSRHRHRCHRRRRGPHHCSCRRPGRLRRPGNRPGRPRVPYVRAPRRRIAGLRGLSRRLLKADSVRRWNLLPSGACFMPSRMPNHQHVRDLLGGGPLQRIDGLIRPRRGTPVARHATHARVPPVFERTSPLSNGSDDPLDVGRRLVEALERVAIGADWVGDHAPVPFPAPWVRPRAPAVAGGHHDVG